MTSTLALSRRGLLRVGLFGGAALAGAGLFGSLANCSAESSAAGFTQLRGSDLPFLRRLTAVVLDGAVPPERLAAAVAGTLQSIDAGLGWLSPALQTQMQQLFDLITLPVTRGPLTGVWGDWTQASDADVRAFLHRWEHSRLMLLRQGHTALLQLTLMGWYGRPESWAGCGYPGPPAI